MILVFPFLNSYGGIGISLILTGVFILNVLSFIFLNGIALGVLVRGFFFRNPHEKD
jgi:hypothetical protein